MAVKYTMNFVFTALMLVSAIVLLFTNPNEIFPSMIEGVQGGINLVIKLTAIYAVWLSVLKIMERTALDNKLSKVLKPVIKRLFKGESEDSYKWISVNLASNMLGMGGASTPAGIEAMKSMEKGDKATGNMSLLIVINATSIQLIPATVIALRSTAGSANPANIILPTLISSTIATVAGAILVKMFCYGKNKMPSLKEVLSKLKTTARSKKSKTKEA